ncbi:hypothetical protein F511_01797 [Dorcoceras hygrometricum]|uniref:Thioredoxin domain-containing protein n=1 Tax=Dorcoceras hygrometricum TaxID=472368 RepID=A0A2Z7AR48_9LAMI|nr:hypothetical protein F511_01797 [Dorcoceras hygrometricum]
MRGLRVVVRRLVAGTASRTAARSSSISENLVLSSAAAYSAILLAEDKSSARFISSIAPGGAFNCQAALQNHFRNFSSSPSSVVGYSGQRLNFIVWHWDQITDSSNIVSIESKEQFTDSLRKVQDESLPAIFYFTAVWCGPCRLLSPVIGQLSEKYPHVTTYKIDIDKEELGNELSKLNIHSVHTFEIHVKSGSTNTKHVMTDAINYQLGHGKGESPINQEQAKKPNITLVRNKREQGTRGTTVI